MITVSSTWLIYSADDCLVIVRASITEAAVIGSNVRGPIQTPKFFRIAITNSKKNANEKESEKHKFNKVRQLPTSSRQKGRKILFNQSTQVAINGDNTPFYIDREPIKKKTQQL